MGRGALWPERRPESIAVGQVKSQEISQELEEPSVTVPERSDSERSELRTTGEPAASYRVSIGD